MWCPSCQQDVPSVACGAEGPLVCPRCEADLSPPVFVEVTTTAGTPAEWSPQGDAIEQEELRQQLRRIAGKLGSIRREHFRREQQMKQKEPTLRIDWAHGPSAVSGGRESGVCQSNLSNMAMHIRSEPPHARRTGASMAISLLLLAGLVGLAGGVGLLVWLSTGPNPVAGPHQVAWQWGIAVTITGQGMLVAGLVWMTWRLWRNGRRINRQLHYVGRQLEQIEHLTGTLADRRITTSGTYYDHYARGASPHMLLANLQGGMEQLAARCESRHG